MKKILAFLLIALSSVISYETSLFAKPRVNKEDMVIGAYVYQSKKGIPDPQLVTHVFFAFAHVSESFDGLYIPDEGELKRVADLKKKNPEVKVLLSVGGWGSGRFSEMAASARSRSSFAKDCKKAVKKFHLDGIDIDWEYPTSSSAKISSSPEDTGNFSLLMKDLREALGRRKLLSIATVCNAKYIDFKTEKLREQEIKNFIDNSLSAFSSNERTQLGLTIRGKTRKDALKAYGAFASKVNDKIRIADDTKLEKGILEINVVTGRAPTLPWSASGFRNASALRIRRAWTTAAVPS